MTAARTSQRRASVSRLGLIVSPVCLWLEKFTLEHSPMADCVTQVLFACTRVIFVSQKELKEELLYNASIFIF